MRRFGVLLAALIVVLTGCGNDASATIVGTTGITVNEAGKPVALVALCEGSVDQVTISGDRTGLAEDEPNPDIGTWKASEPDGSGVVTIDLGALSADPDWTMGDVPALEEGRTYIAIADQSDADAEATQVTFSLADLTPLTPKQVLVRDSEVLTRAEFDASCS